MAQNIINQNLDQYGLQYGEGLNPYAPDVQIDNMPTNRGYTNFDDQEVGIINTDIGNQMADVSRNQLNQLNRLGAGSGMSLNEIKEMSPPGVFDSVTPQEFQQIQDGTFNKDNLVSSIGSGLENFFFPSAGAAEVNPNNTFTSSVANSPYEMDYMPPDRYRDFEPTSWYSTDYGTSFHVTEEKLSLFQRGKDLVSSGIGKAGKVGIDAFNMLKNNNPLGFISSLANTRNPLNPGSSNYDSNLQDQIDSLKGQTGTRITGTSDNLKFTDGLSMINDNKYGLGSVLAGKNVTSGFGTNNYEVSLQDYIDKMMGYKTRSTFQKAKVDRARRELAAEQSRQQSALEAQLAAAARESARMGYQDYGSGAASQIYSRFISRS